MKNSDKDKSIKAMAAALEKLAIALDGPAMQNKAMERKLQNGDAVDVSGFARDKDGNYVLPDYADGIDYADKKREAWIWSIGRRRSDGVILASTDSRFYQNDAFECLWLR
jgi:hypothetical protein